MFICGYIYDQGFFCDGTRRYSVPGNENDESIFRMSVLH